MVGLSELIQKIMSNNLDNNNIKLCPGGIRSIELMLSALQLLYGGRSVELQSPYTYEILNLLEDYKFNHKVEVEKNVMKQECENILKDFFKNLRKIKSKK